MTMLSRWCARRPRPLIMLAAAVVLLAAGCAAHQVRRMPDSVAEIDELAARSWEAAARAVPERTPGSIWEEGGMGDSLIADTHASRMNDLVTVRIVESTEGENSADAQLDKDSTNDFGVPQLFGAQAGLAGKPNKGFDLADLFRTKTQKKFDGSGATTRTSKLVTTLTSRVFRVFPNGNLAILGRKEITVNHEHQILWLAGLVRPADILADNSVASTRIAELSLWLSGQGDVDDTLREGWLSRWISRVWPF
ncbi:MAG: flagellar basal body L-ring protein FlgH [Acidobacteriota bacterium]